MTSFVFLYFSGIFYLLYENAILILEGNRMISFVFIIFFRIPTHLLKFDFHSRRESYDFLRIFRIFQNFNAFIKIQLPISKGIV